MTEASILLDRPPGGWSDLATNQALAAFEARLERRFVDVERRFVDVERRFVELETNIDLRMQSAINKAFTNQLRWMVASMTGLLAVVVAAIKL